MERQFLQSKNKITNEAFKKDLLHLLIYGTLIMIYNSLKLLRTF